jgi:hypothetical protein
MPTGRCSSWRARAPARHAPWWSGLRAWCASAPPRRLKSRPSPSRARQRPSCASAWPRSSARAPLAFRCKTFHALGLDLLRAHAAAAGLPPHFAILDEAGRQALLARVYREAGACDLSPARMANLISAAKAALIAPADAAPELAAIYAAYEKALAVAGAVDFDDLVARAVRLLETDQSALFSARARCRHLLVDEYQDINAAQYRLVRLLAPAGPSTNLCAVGDPDQAIYGFRGSDPRISAALPRLSRGAHPHARPQLPFRRVGRAPGHCRHRTRPGSRCASAAAAGRARGAR